VTIYCGKVYIDQYTTLEVLQSPILGHVLFIDATKTLTYCFYIVTGKENLKIEALIPDFFRLFPNYELISLAAIVSRRL
jgi:hypothetical protein